MLGIACLERIPTAAAQGHLEQLVGEDLIDVSCGGGTVNSAPGPSDFFGCNSFEKIVYAMFQ